MSSKDILVVAHQFHIFRVHEEETAEPSVHRFLCRDCEQMAPYAAVPLALTSVVRSALRQLNIDSTVTL